MTDETKGGDQPQTPEKGDVDLDALVEKMNAEFNKEFGKRFSGLQSLLDQRDTEYRQMVEDLRNADLTPEEREQANTSKLQQEVETLRRQNEILSMGKTHPEEAALLEGFLKAGSLQDQIALLSQFRKSGTPESPTPEGEPAAEGGEPTPTDKNNPARPTQPSLESAAARMNKSLADQIMNASGSEKGLLARLRKG